MSKFGFRSVKHESENLKTVEFQKASCIFYFRAGPEAHEERVSDNVGRNKMQELAEELLAFGLEDEDKGTYSSAWAQYKEISPDWQTVEERGETSKNEWQFHAAQLTCNCCVGEWISNDGNILKALFDRFTAFLFTCLVSLNQLHFFA